MKYPKKIKKIPVKRLEKQMDVIVSKIVCKRDPVCVTCGSMQSPGCGHVFSRRPKSTRWDLRNCHRQCWPCNYKHVHDTKPYYTWYIDTYGREAFEELYRDFKTIKKWKRQDLENRKSELETLLISMS